MISIVRKCARRSSARKAMFGLWLASAAAVPLQPAQAVLVRDDVGLDASVDTANQYPAVMQLINVSAADGPQSSCSGTLISPRTVLTAAHCVRDVGSENFGAFGSGAPYTMIAGFGVDNSARVAAFLNHGTGYYAGGAPMSTDVIVHPSASTAPGYPDLPFPWTDVTLVALNTPITDVAPMAVLLSPMHELTHVIETGYGQYGTGGLGPLGSGPRRLVGENMMQLIASVSDVYRVVRPSVVNGNVVDPYYNSSQLEYFTDFDNPSRGTANAGCSYGGGQDLTCDSQSAAEGVDYLAGDALPREVSVYHGDSGGPLIADQIFSKPLVIGDLSGGIVDAEPNFPPGYYGASGLSYYQPLSSVWQFIVANNPYKYVGAKAGNGAWEDPGHWVQLLDPSYYVFDANGDIVPGVPTGSEQNVYANGPELGTILGVELTGHDSQPWMFLPPQDANYPDIGGNLPRASALQGPGSTGFVPDNTDGTIGTAFASPAQYFDVTLAADGTTTLSSHVTVDRLTIEGNAGLDIQAPGALLSNIDAELYDNGRLNIDGVIAAPDLIADGGVISGNGRIVLDAQFLVPGSGTVAIGDAGITAGGIGSTGTLTIMGSLAISKGGAMLVDASADGIDQIAVSDNVLMQGAVVFHSIDTPYWHEGGDFLRAGAITVQSLSVPDTLPGVLYPEVTLSTGPAFDALAIRVEAAPFDTVFTPRNGEEASFASMLTAARNTSYDALQPLYRSVDVLDGDTLADAFDQLAPTQQQGLMSAGEVGLNVISDTIGQRLDSLRFARRDAAGTTGTGFADRAADSLTLAMNRNLSPNSAFVQSAFAQAFADKSTLLTASAGAAGPVSVGAAQAAGPAQWGGFLTASAINGSAQYGARNKDITGYTVTAGLDTLVAQRAVLGAAFSTGEADADLPNGKASLNSYQGTVYGSWSNAGGDLFVNGFAGYGRVDGETTRIAAVGGSLLSSRARPTGDQAIAGLSVGTAIPAGWSITLYPTGGLEYDYFHTDAYSEAGSAVALHVAADSSAMLLVRVGARARGDFALDDDTILHPHLRAAWVGALARDDGRFAAAFAAAPLFAGSFSTLHDSNWLELGGGLDADLGRGITLGVGYDATVGRREASYGAVTGRLRVVF